MLARPSPPTRCTLRTAARRAALAFLVGATGVLACARGRESPAPSFLLVSLDPVRADHLGAYGSPRGTSPHFDRLARRGTLFAECMAQATATLPSHRSLFRSRAASRSRAETPMLAEILREAGYATCGLTGGGNIAGSLGFSEGFDAWEEDRGGLAWANPAFARWLDAEARAKFFAFVHTYDAHIPYDPPRALAEYFDPGYEGVVTGAVTRPLARAIRGLDDYPGGTPALGDADRRRLVALYDGAIRNADDLFGGLLRELESRELLEETAIVVFSDHGEEFWDHGSLLHSHTVHRELVHVPLVIVPSAARGGGRKAVRSTPAPAAETAGSIPGGVVRLLDVSPTILALAALPAEPSHEGESLAPFLGGRAAKRIDRAAIMEMSGDKAILEYPWKLIVEKEGARARLYDVAADPAEAHDLAAGAGASHGPRPTPDRPHPAAADSIAAALARKLAANVAAESVDELSHEAMSPEQHERLKALGYVD